MNLEKVKLKKIGKIVTGCTPRTKNEEYYKNKDYMFVGPADIKSCKYVRSSEKYISNTAYIYYSNRFIDSNSIMVDCIGSDMGNVALSVDKVLTNQQINSITEIDENRFNVEYIYYVLSTMKKYFHQIGTNGSTMPIINKSMFEEIEVEVPQKYIQDKIVNVLRSIDKKIELNNQINDNLLEIGDILYKEYFEKEKLPNEWEVCKLKDVACNFDYKRKPMSSREREEHKGIYPYYGATSIIDYVDDYIFDGIYLLMGEDGTVVKSDGKPVLQYIWGKNWINNHAHVLKGNKISTEHLMFCLRNCNVRDIVTGAVQPKINQENMNNIKIIFADEKTNKEFEKIIYSIMEQYKSNIEENQNLKQLRDTLLPKLINGEIDLENIEV